MPLQSPIRDLRHGGRPRSTPAGSEASLVPKARPRRWRAASRPVPSLRAWAAPRRTSLTYAPHSLPHIPQALLAVAAACVGEGEYGDATRLFTQHAFFCYDTSQQAATPRQQAATPRHQAATSRATWLQPHVPAGCNPCRGPQPVCACLCVQGGKGIMLTYYAHCLCVQGGKGTMLTYYAHCLRRVARASCRSTPWRRRAPS